MAFQRSSQSILRMQLLRRPASQYRWRQFSTHISPVSNYNPVDVAQQTHKDSGVPIESAGLALDSKFQTQGYVSPHFAPTPRVPLSPVPAEHPDWKKLDGGELLGEDKVAKSGLLKTVVDVVKAIPFLNKITNSPSTASPHRLEDRPQTFMPEVDFHTKTPMEMIAEVPIIYVESDTVACWGGPDQSLSSGHPIVYLRMNRVKQGSHATCGYCGLRYAQKAHH